MTAAHGTVTLIDQLLSEQRLMTPVARFSREHEAGRIEQEQYYRDLIPLSRPEAGQQYAFAVDLDACTACKACVSACHSMNGLDPGESWRDVGVLFGGTTLQPIQQTVTTACHHCVEPGCLLGCPVMAYEKDAGTGIVRHLDDQCIGCQYCILKCPYDVPKYHKELGIVRKCDMCFNRLAVGEAPACVAACPNEAIRIEVVSQADIVAASAGGRLVPGAFDSGYTRPTTSYRSRRALLAELKSADEHHLRVEHAHWPLVIMLVLTQAAAGLFLLDTLTRLTGLTPHPLLAVTGALLAGTGLGASVLHLGKPLRAWRAFLGLRTSWLSREVIGFGTWAPPAMGFAALLWVPEKWMPLALPLTMLSTTVSLLGVLCVFCSVMVYADTRRAFWTLPLTGGKFFGTMLCLGMAGAAALGGSRELALLGAGAVSLKLVMEGLFFRHVDDAGWTPARQSSLVMLRRLPASTAVRFISGIAGMACLVTGVSSLVIAACFFLLFGEILERSLFFRAVVAPRMPGGIAS